MKMLWDLKQFLVGAYGTSPSVVKLHVYTHSPPFILSLGAPKNSDTQVLEHAHRAGVHLPSLRISNRSEDITRELLKHSLVKRRIDLLNDVMNNKKDDHIEGHTSRKSETIDMRRSIEDPDRDLEATMKPCFSGRTPRSDITQSGAPRKGLVELEWRSSHGRLKRANNSADRDSWIVKPSASSIITAAGIPLHPILLPSSLTRGHVDHILPLPTLDDYLKTFLTNLVSNGNEESNDPAKNPKEFFRWLIDEAKKDRECGLYRLFLVPSCRLDLKVDSPDQSNEEADDLMDDDADDGQDDTSIANFSVVGSDFDGNPRGGFSKKDFEDEKNCAFVLHATNSAKKSSVSASTRRQFDFVEVQWTSDSEDGGVDVSTAIVLKNALLLLP
jgi:hypothetical protein